MEYTYLEEEFPKVCSWGVHVREKYIGQSESPRGDKVPSAYADRDLRAASRRA